MSYPELPDYILSCKKALSSLRESVIQIYDPNEAYIVGSSIFNIVSPKDIDICLVIPDHPGAVDINTITNEDYMKNLMYECKGRPVPLIERYNRSFDVNIYTRWMDTRMTDIGLQAPFYDLLNDKLHHTTYGSVVPLSFNWSSEDHLFHAYTRGRKKRIINLITR